MGIIALPALSTLSCAVKLETCRKRQTGGETGWARKAAPGVITKNDTTNGLDPVILVMDE